MSFLNSYDDSTQYGFNDQETVVSSTCAISIDGKVGFSPTPSYSIGETLLGLYRVTSNPYVGGMGSVVRVHHTTWNVDLAMKQPHVRTLNSAQGELFIHECEAWINLGLHPNIVACYYVRNIDGVPSIFSEWMEEGSLKDKITSSALYQGEPNAVLCRIIDILIQSARGIAFAHTKGLVHQDIKPANILCGKEGTIKIADFGLANIKKLIVESGSSKTGETTLAANGGYTLQYCSPEQLKGHPVSVRTDIWSWAVTALEMFVGACKWNNGPIAGFAFETYLEQAVVEIPDSLKMLLSSCFQEEAEKRPHNFDSIISILLSIYRDISGEEYFRTAPKTNLLTAEFLNNKALSFIDLEKYDEAEAAWEQALSIAPHHVDSLFNHTLWQWRNGVLTDLDVMSKFQSRYKQNSHDYSLPYAELLCESGRYALAKSICKNRTDLTAKRVLDFVGDRLDDFSIISEMHITNNPNVNIHETGIHVDPKDRSVLACEITENGNLFHRMGRNDHAFRVDKEIVVTDPKERICIFVFTNGGKHIWGIRTNHTIDILDAETYQVLKRVYSREWGWFSGSPVILYALSNETGDLVAFLSSTKEHKVCKTIWNVKSEKVIFHKEYDLNQPQSYRIFRTCYFIDTDSVYLGDSILHFDNERNVTEIPFHHPINKEIITYQKLAHHSFRGFVFPVDHSMLHVYEGVSQQCLQTVDTHISSMHPFGISSDGQRILLYRSKDIIQQLSFSFDRYRCDFHLSKIISVNDTEQYEKQFKTLYDSANECLSTGNIALALKHIEEASQIPGYNNDSSLMELNRKVGKYCRISGFRNFDFSVDKPIGIGDFSINPSMPNFWEFDRNNHITICNGIILDLLSGRTYPLAKCKNKTRSGVDVTVGRFWNHSLLLWNRKTSLEAYLDSQGQSFSSLITLLESKPGMAIKQSNHAFIDDPTVDKKKAIKFKQVSADEKYLVTIQANSTIAKWNISDGNAVSYIEQNEDEFIFSCALSASGEFLALLFHASIKIWDIDKKHCTELNLQYVKERISSSGGHNIVSIIFLDNNDLLTCDQKGQIIIWDIAQNHPKKVITLSTETVFSPASSSIDGWIKSCALSPDQQFLLVCGKHIVSLVDLQRGIATDQPYDKTLEGCRFTADRNTILLEESGFKKQFGIVNWKYEFPGWADWDERAMPILNEFLNKNPNPSEEDIDDLMLLLQNKDLGWLRRDGIKKKIQNIQNNLKEIEYQKRIQEENQRAALRQQYRREGLCEHCGGKFKGLFKKTCSVCGSPKSY